MTLFSENFRSSVKKDKPNGAIPLIGIAPANNKPKSRTGISQNFKSIPFRFFCCTCREVSTDTNSVFLIINTSVTDMFLRVVVQIGHRGRCMGSGHPARKRTGVRGCNRPGTVLY